MSWSPPRPGPPEAWVPRPYPQLLRGPSHRWWRSLVSLAVVIGGLVLIAGATAAVVVVATLVGAVDAAAVEKSLDDWWMLLLTNLGLAALIPVSMLAVWAGHRWRPRWVASVGGGIRWRWLLAASLTSLVVLAGASALLYAVDGLPSGTGSQVVPLLLIVALTTPLQAAGEEYLFRGWLTQAVGCLFARALLGAVVAALVSSTLFALAHGGQDPWLFADRFAFGLLASFLVWRTGGLEASIAAHTVNNVVVFVPTILTGGLTDALTASAAPPGAVLLDLVGMVVLGAVLAWLAARRGVQRRFVPPPPLVPPPAGPVLVPPAHLG